jgi:hypothetical protein
MEKEFIPYEQAIDLKELGFESPYPIGGYQSGKVFYYEKGELYYDGRPMYSSDAHSGQLLAPLYQQAFRWFREKYKIHSSTFWMEIDKSIYWNYRYSYLDDKSTESVNRSIFYFNTPEEAELECLKKLIKIVKEQKEYESNIIV